MEEDKEMTYGKSLDAVLRLMEADQTLTDARIEEMMGDEEACRLLNDFQDCKQALREKFGQRSPNVADEWSKFIADKADDFSASTSRETPAKSEIGSAAEASSSSESTAKAVAATTALSSQGTTTKGATGSAAEASARTSKEATAETRASEGTTSASSAPHKAAQVSFMRQHRQLFVGGLIGIAATLLCLFLFTWYQRIGEAKLPEGMVVFEAKNTPQTITLKSGDGEALPLDDYQPSDAMPELIASNGGTKLNYQKAVDKRPPIVQLLTTPIGKDFQVTLSDGTQVYLSADSRLVYPSRFEGQERMVTLEGEAYFDVAKDSQRPFIVKTEHLGVKVLGTKFNISNYTGKLTRVTLIEGSVNVTNAKDGKSLVMRPSDEVTIDSQGNVTQNTIDVDGYVYWQEGFFYFDNQPLSEIMQTIGKWYNVNVVFVNEAAMNYRFHYLCERNAGIQHAIELLNRMKNLDVTLQGMTVVVR